jgi:3-oxoacyl-[acyl-carrier protein] reductase
MHIDLQSKRALVCGASQGIGLATAQALAECGASVTLLARNIDELQRALASLSSSNGQVHNFLSVNFDNRDATVQSLSEHINNTGSYDILINNSGGPPGGSLISADPEEFITAMNRLLLTGHSILQLLTPTMMANRWGRVINIISTSVRQPLQNLGVSNTIRGATSSWAKTLSFELASFGITVNNVLPGATNTQRLQSIIERTSKNKGKTIEEIMEEMMDEIPMKRFAEPREIANAVAFLSSPLADYITGINLTVDGGRTKSLL